MLPGVSQAAFPLMLLAVGLFAGAVWGRWTTRKGHSAQGDAETAQRLDDLLQAKEASEQLNANLQEALNQMEQAAGTDRLTGAWNRRRFEDGVMRHIALSVHRNDDLSLIFMDLDHFRRINEAFGRDAGDRVLSTIAETVRNQLRISDALIRWGGEEFIVLCPATTLAGTAILAEKIRQAVEALSIPGVGRVTISLGVAQNQTDEPFTSWMARAELAMRRAKSLGRNRTETTPEGTEGAEQQAPPLFELIWDGSLECGHPLIDEQHRQLYGLCNSLLMAVTSGVHPEDAKLQMQMVLAHVAQHFHDEEALLAEKGYPELKAHIAEHARLAAKVKALQHDMGGDSTDLPPLLSFLALDLVKGHLMCWDRRFFKWMAETKAKPIVEPGTLA